MTTCVLGAGVVRSGGVRCLSLTGDGQPNTYSGIPEYIILLEPKNSESLNGSVMRDPSRSMTYLRAEIAPRSRRDHNTDGLAPRRCARLARRCFDSLDLGAILAHR